MRLSSLFALALPLLGLVPVAACDDSSSGGTSSGDFDAAPTPFDGSTAPQDSSVGDTSVSADAAADAAADSADATSPPIGEALLFDGVDDRVELPTADGAANETAFSVEVWFKTAAPTGTFFEVYGNGGADRFIFIDGGKVCFYVFTGAGNKLCTVTAGYDDGAWHHAAGTLGAAAGTNVYVDGVLGATLATVTASTFVSDTNFRLGFGHTDINSEFDKYAGELDEVRVWSVERSATDIQASYKQHIAANTPGLQGYWKLDETGAATTTKDATAGAHDGVLTNFTFAPSPWVTPGAF